MPVRPIVLIAEELSPATVQALGSDVEVRWCDGTDRDRLLSDVAQAHALLVRSATQVDAELLAAGRSLVVVARAGVGLDNVDVDAATQAGVMVVNAPVSNIVSAAELAIGLILATARHIPQAHASLRSGEWKRAQFIGTELEGKTVGVLGLGRIGALVCRRLAGFGVRLIGYDPYVSTARAAQLGVHLASLEDVLAEADVITVHLPRTPETVGLISYEQLALVKPTARIINAARGGIVDEQALYTMLKEGRLAGAGLDVYANEPCTDSPLFDLDTVVVTPHLGASTEEAQENAGIAVAHSVRLALAGELVPDAVNVSGGAIDKDVRPGIPLVEKLGRIFTAVSGSVPVNLDVEVRGEIAALDVSVLGLAALKGVLLDVVESAVTFVNAPSLASERGITMRVLPGESSPHYRNVVVLRGTTDDGSQVAVAGTLTGPKQVEKLVGIDDLDLEVPITEHMVVLRYEDRPGVIGAIGTAFGQVGVNIASMQVARPEAGGRAVGVLTLDQSVPVEALEALVTDLGACSGRQIHLS